MTQNELFQRDDDRRTAIDADVTTAGGPKIVGPILWPKLDPVEAGKKLSNALNPNQKQQLKDCETWVIKYLARKQGGISQLHALESKLLDCDIQWISNDDLLERAHRRIATLAAELNREIEYSRELTGQKRVKP